MKPRVILFNAVSLDGRIDRFTPDIGLFYGLASAWQEDATLAGCDTLLHAPDPIPPETEADLAPPEAVPGDSRPLLVVPDRRGRLRTWHFWRKQPYWRDCIAWCSGRTPRDYLEYLDQRGIPYMVSGDEQVDCAKCLERLHAEHGVRTVRVDSGGTLNGVLLRLGLVDEVSLLVHPALVGGTTPKTFFRAPDLDSADGVVRLKLKNVTQHPGDIVQLTYDVDHRNLSASR